MTNITNIEQPEDVYDDDSLQHLIATTLIPGIGSINAKKLITWCGSASEVFKNSRQELIKIPGLAALMSQKINTKELLNRAEKEIRFIRQNNITPLYYYNEDFPPRLRHCADSPLLLYYKGVKGLWKKRSLAIVGTRHATHYGRRVCEEVVEGFRDDNMLIISGLAYGIDSCAHAKSMHYGLPTLGVMAHGLDRIYPDQNRNMARRMLKNGGLITEFMSGSKPDRENFPKRNRIIAGLSDAVLVVESATKGGAVITADIAHSYNRDVFAVPGRVSDEVSDGCHLLIRRNVAALARSADDIKYSMDWESAVRQEKTNARILEAFPPEEKKILSIIIEKGRAPVDDIVLIAGFGATKTASILLKLEFEGVIVGLPGKMYEIRR